MQFGLVVAPFRSFEMLTVRDEQRGCLDCIRRHLLPAGRGILHLMVPGPEYRQAGELGPCEAWSSELGPGGGGTTIRVENLSRHNDTAHQVRTETWRFVEVDAAGEIHREETRQLRARWTHPEQMRGLLAASGLKVASVHGDFSGAPLGNDGHQVWEVCR